jgi:hypothetical protein
VPGTNEQQLQGLLTQMVWDERALHQRRVQIMRALHTEGDGTLILDDTGFAKQGQQSVGVARQYSGTLGKVANCQITVNCHLPYHVAGRDALVLVESVVCGCDAAAGYPSARSADVSDQSCHWVGLD